MLGQLAHPGCLIHLTPGCITWVELLSVHHRCPPPQPCCQVPHVFVTFGLVIVRDFPSQEHFSPCLIRLVVSAFAFLKHQPLIPASSLPPHLQRKTHWITWVPASGSLLTLPLHALPFLLPWKIRNREVNLCGWYSVLAY